MREIEFRGKSVVTGEWVYGNLLSNNEGAFIVEDSEVSNWYADGSDLYAVEWHKVDSSSIGQLTGLKDCNGKMIYEGDIVECEIGINKERYVGICEFNKRTAGFEFGKKRTSSYGRTNMTVGRMKNKRVIGNIYENENPELLGDSD